LVVGAFFISAKRELGLEIRREYLERNLAGMHITIILQASSSL